MEDDEVAIAQMVADLGAGRRDLLSAPEEGGRRAGADLRDEMRALEEAQEHRRQAMSGPEGNGRADMLRLWHTETLFDSDAIADSLENRMDGQGHRARLQGNLHPQQTHIDDHHRAQRNYLYNNNDRAPPGRGRPNEQDRTPRNLHFAPPPGRTPAADSNRARARAPSPRAAGVTRFRNGQRVISGTAPTSTSAQAPRMPTAMRRNGISSQPAQLPRPSTQAASSSSPAHISRPASAVNAPSRPIDAPQHAPARATTMAPPPTPTPRSQTAAAAGAPVAASFSAGATLKPEQAVAVAHVEIPSEKYERYYQNNPDQVPHLESARKDLAIDAVNCIRNGQKEVYVEKYPNRKWLVEIAETALTRGDVPSCTAQTKPTIKAIIQAAIEQIRKENAAKMSAPNTPALPIAAPKPSQPSATLASAAPAQTPSTNIPPSQHRSALAPSALKNMIKERGDVAVKVATPRRGEGSQTATSSVVADIGAQSRCDSAMEVSSPAVTPQRAYAPIRGGMLTATYHDANGNVVKQDQIRVDAPVMANITIASTKQHYDPRQLITAMQTLAQEMADRSMGNFRRGDDGLWAEA